MTELTGELGAGAFDAPWRTRGEHVVSAKGLGIAEVVTAAPFEKVEAIARLVAAAPDLLAENERLRELLYQALAEGGIPPADYAVSLNHDTGQAFLLFGSREARDA